MTWPRLRVVVRQRAARQIDEANDWWREHRTANPGALADELTRTFELIAAQPGIGAPAREPRLRGVRRVLLRRVGYFLHYRVALRKGELQVLVFKHSRWVP